MHTQKLIVSQLN